jgi:hypothetical protein
MFDTSIKQSDRTAVSAVADRLVAHSFHMMSKTLFEEDRPIFAILAALETEDSLGKIAVGDRECLIMQNQTQSLCV